MQSNLHKLSKQDIKNIMYSGECYSLSGIKFFAQPAVQSTARCAVLVPKKCVRLATKRNYLKRVARHAIRAQFTKSNTFDLVCLITSNELLNLPTYDYIANGLQVVYAE